MPRIFRNRSRESDEQAKIALLRITHIRFRAFAAKFGRDPRIDEPLFFDESQDQPVEAQGMELQEQLARGAREAGVELEPVLRFLAQPNHQVPVARRSASWPEFQEAGPLSSANWRR